MQKKPLNQILNEGFPYWLEVPLLTGATSNLERKCSIAVIGSGLSGVSTAYFLQKEGFKDISILDYKPEQSASYRNCGHILYGTVESMKAFSAIHGKEKAQELWGFSIEICDLIGQTTKELNLDADYKKQGYLAIAINEAEERECQEATQILNSMGFQSEFWERSKVGKLGFRNTFGARFEAGSAQAHPVKFRNGVLKHVLENGGKYFSQVKVTSLKENSNGVTITTDAGTIEADAAVIAANAYSPLFSDFFNTRRLVEPFRGQILTSKPLNHSFSVKYPHSFDHGYEYALVTKDNRLMIGGWRNNSPTREIGTYSLKPNNFISEGLAQFVDSHYEIDELIEWDYSWAGIMGASQTSLPFIGPTNSDRIYSIAGFTGHGFSWAHGSARLLSKIMAGAEIPSVAKHFNPRHRS